MSSSAVLHETDLLQAFTAAEVCERLRISERKLRDLLAENKLRTVFPRASGSAVRIPASSLRDFLENNS